MAKPAGALCNLSCGYCYYINKGVKGECGADAQKSFMSDDVLESFVKSYIEQQSMPEVLFTWHGGEPMVRGLEFYKKVMALQRKYAKGIHVDNVLQTNGVLLNEEWCEFLHDNGWLVGISIDGPKEIHDKYRRDTAQKPSFDKVMRGIELLKRYDVMWNAMAVVTKDSALRAREVYRFFKSIEAKYIQFSPLVYNPECANMEHLSPMVKDGALTAELWGDFLCNVFDEWEKEDVGEYYVELFDATLACYVGVEPGTCCFSPECGRVGVIESNGDVYSCDHFVVPEFRLGNIRNASLLSMMDSKSQRAFGEAKSASLPEKCMRCEFLKLCYGECPKNRNADGVNILCEGYRRYFLHTKEFMEEQARLLQSR